MLVAGDRRTDRVATGRLLGTQVEKKQQSNLVSRRSLGGFAKGLIRLGGSPAGALGPGLPFPGRPLRPEPAAARAAPLIKLA